MNEELLSPSKLEKEVNSSKLILHNDDRNSFEWIILALTTILNISTVNAEQLAMIAHYKGKATIKHGSEEQLEEFRDSFSMLDVTTTVEK
jgi:ATP-dependent Clp protease adaptor protein ClpS